MAVVRSIRPRLDSTVYGRGNRSIAAPQTAGSGLARSRARDTQDRSQIAIGGDRVPSRKVCHRRPSRVPAATSAQLQFIDPVLRADDLAHPRDGQCPHSPRFTAWLTLRLALDQRPHAIDELLTPEIQPWNASDHGDSGGCANPAVTYLR